MLMRRVRGRVLEGIGFCVAGAVVLLVGGTVVYVLLFGLLLMGPP